LGIFFSPASAAVHKTAPVSKKARIIKERISRPSKSIHKKPRAKAMVHKKTKAKVATKKESLFWKIIWNPVIMCIWIPLAIALFVIADQAHRLYFQKEPEEPAGAAQEDTDDPRSWDQRFRDKIKGFIGRFKKEPATPA